MNKKELKLPKSNKFPASNRCLSMDKYVEFINFIHRYFRGNKVTKNEELDMRVNVPFVI